MSEENDLTIEAKKLVSDFQDTVAYKSYQQLLKSQESNARLLKLDKDRKDLQSKIKYLSPEKQKEAIKLCKELNDEYNNDPLIVNLRQAKEEVLNLLYPLNNTGL